MSSAPSGLDVREYVYGYFFFTPSAPGTYTISAQSNWLVTKVSLFAAAAGANLALLAGIPVAANGCLILEPNGAFRSDIDVGGVGANLIVEYWIRGIAGGAQVLPVTVTGPV